jgi:ribosomal small subunit protein bTHX
MGKGDRKTRRGKIRRSSYGKSRKRASKKKKVATRASQ